MAVGRPAGWQPPNGSSGTLEPVPSQVVAVIISFLDAPEILHVTNTCTKLRDTVCDNASKLPQFKFIHALRYGNVAVSCWKQLQPQREQPREVAASDSSSLAVAIATCSRFYAVPNTVDGDTTVQILEKGTDQTVCSIPLGQRRGWLFALGDGTARGEGIAAVVAHEDSTFRSIHLAAQVYQFGSHVRVSEFETTLDTLDCAYDIHLKRGSGGIPSLHLSRGEVYFAVSTVTTSHATVVLRLDPQHRTAHRVFSTKGALLKQAGDCLAIIRRSSVRVFHLPSESMVAGVAVAEGVFPVHAVAGAHVLVTEEESGVALEVWDSVSKAVRAAYWSADATAPRAPTRPPSHQLPTRSRQLSSKKLLRMMQPPVNPPAAKFRLPPPPFKLPIPPKSAAATSPRRQRPLPTH